ncbi:BRE1 E3 ubiquitin ligase-domain-containing protein [Cyathus striatus]|nr:BRE1 E3 ubiquitin ligase-domain-containing protein [Cyathus striatus]
MESKKRPLADRDESIVAKKRVLTGANGSPHVNGGGSEPDESSIDDNLELFRKEAIYRRMKYYSRENERNQTRIAELERRKNTCEAGLAAISACWAQLVDTIRLLVKSDELPQVDIDAKELFDLTSHVDDTATPELAAALGDTMNATQSLVTRFVQLNRSSKSQLTPMDGYIQCQKAQTECAALRSQLTVVQSQLEDCKTQKDRYYTALTAAENRLERSKSGTVQVIESRQSTSEKLEVKGEEKEEAQGKPSSPARTPEISLQSNGIHTSSEIEALNEQLQSRERQISELEKEASALRDEKTVLELNLKNPSQDSYAETPHYKAVAHHAAVLEGSLTEKTEQLTKLMEELHQLQLSRREWEESVIAASMQASQELRTMLSKRDAENARLREQREQQAAELNERRQKDKDKLASTKELKTLVESRSDRIAALESEVRRCKAQLAANAGQEDLMRFFLDGNIEVEGYIDSLKQEKTRFEGRVAALEQTFSIYQDDHPDVVQHMRAEAEALQQLSEATAQLKQYQKVYGDEVTLPLDVSRLREKLKEKESELEKLRLLESQHVEAEKSLFTELEKLSTAWETLDRQLKGKIFDLSVMEERCSKAGLDKAKSENKYYAAMRDKEAIEVERKNLQRSLDKQAKVVDRLVDAEKNLSGQVLALEKEVAFYKKAVDTLKDHIVRLEDETQDTKYRLESETKRGQELFVLIQERDKGLSTKKAELRKMEDGLVRSRKELDKQTAQLKEAAASSTLVSALHKPAEESNGDLEHYKQILKCSTCRNNFRSVIINKCSHTFCKPCVDARISTRQRKCPACNLPFSQSDVQNMYWQ